MIDRAKKAFNEILECTAAFVRENRRANWKSHCCPNCGAGISRLILLHGYATHNGLKATLRCRSCDFRHALRGNTADNREIMLSCMNNALAYAAKTKS